MREGSRKIFQGAPGTKQFELSRDWLVPVEVLKVW